MSDVRFDLSGHSTQGRMTMAEAAKTVVGNVMMAAIARLMLLVGTPIMIGLLTWFASGFVAMQQLVAVQAAEQARLVSDVRELQDYRRDAFARGAALAKDVGTIKEMLVRLQDSFDKRR